MRLADEQTQKAPAPFNKQARPSDRRPRGQYGPLDHWRLGLVGAVKYWSNGSKAEAAIYIKSLVDRLQLQAHAARGTRCAQNPKSGVEDSVRIRN